MNRKPFLLILIGIFFVTGCDAVGIETAPTPYPDDYLPTVIALTAAAGQTPQPGPEAGASNPTPETQPTATLLPPTAIPILPTDTLISDDLPPEGIIRLIAPGPMSKLVSPIQFIAYIIPGARNRFQVELVGEDGRLLARSVQTWIPGYSPWVYVAYEIPFEIRAVAELARLQVSTQDQFGRSQAIMSVHVLLQSEGRNMINPHGGTGERAWIDQPQEGAQSIGGEVLVSGKFRRFNEQLLIMELLDESGKVLGARVVDLQGTPVENGYLPFSTTVPYNVTEATWARLVIRQSDDRIDGLMYLFSREIYLNP